MTPSISLADVCTFSVAIEKRRDGHYVVATTGGSWGDDGGEFGPMDEADAAELADDFRATNLACGALDMSPGSAS